MRERTTGARIALAALFAALLGAGACSVDPVRDLERKAIGMRPRLLETCLPEASRVEIEDDVERLTYAWTLGERLAGELATDLESIPDPRDEILADSFRDDTPGPRAEIGRAHV